MNAARAAKTAIAATATSASPPRNRAVRLGGRFGSAAFVCASAMRRWDFFFDTAIGDAPAHFSNAKIRFQSSFMLITTQPFFFASSYRACVKVPTLLSGSPRAGP